MTDRPSTRLFWSTQYQDSTAKAHIIGYACYRRKSFVIKLLTNLNLFTKSVTTLIHQDNKNFATLIHQE